MGGSRGVSHPQPLADTTLSPRHTVRRAGPLEVTVQDVGGGGEHKLFFNEQLTGWFCDRDGQRGYREGAGFGSPDDADAPAQAHPPSALLPPPPIARAARTFV